MLAGKDAFSILRNVVIKESFFMFNNKSYKHIDLEDMVSPLGPALANIFTYSF